MKVYVMKSGNRPAWHLFDENGHYIRGSVRWVKHNVVELAKALSCQSCKTTVDLWPYVDYLPRRVYENGKRVDS